MADPDAELVARFGSLEPDVLAELRSIMRLHDITVDDLFWKWEAYSMKLEIGVGEVSLASVRNLKASMQDELEKSSKAAVREIKTERKVGGTPRGDVYGVLDGLVPRTPAAGRKAGGSAVGSSGLKKKTPASKLRGQVPADSSPDLTTPSRTEDQLKHTSFGDRPNAGDIIEVLNDKLPAAEPPIAPYSEPRIKLTAVSDLKKMSYKPLAMKLSEASEILDDRIDEFMHALADERGIDYSSFGSAASQGTTEVIAVGRIACDSKEGGKLNMASVVLETSRRTGGGLRVLLDLKKVKGFAFFPGQIVALRGSNTSGSEFVVEEVIEMPLLHNAASTPAQLDAHRQRARGDLDPMDEDSDPAPLNILFGAGPYTADDNLDFEPLHELVTKAADTYADALVLTGPFIDAEHPLIASGDFDIPDEMVADIDTATMSTLFKAMISPALDRLCQSNPSVTIILVPSTRDMLSKHVSWPQDILPRKELGLPKAARVVSNPMTLNVNEMTLGLSSQDILYELRHEELVFGKVAHQEVSSRLCRHLIEQRHYFPLFPPADRSKLPRTGLEDGKGAPPGAMLDVSYLKLGEVGSVRPDVMVVPSALQPFARVVESVLVINPGYLSKRRGAGTYARMTLYPRKVEDHEADKELLTHNVYSRARVEVTRI